MIVFQNNKGSGEGGRWVKFFPKIGKIYFERVTYDRSLPLRLQV